MKTCTKCKQTKPFSEFYKRHDRPSGYRSSCKSCDRNRFKKYRQTEQGKATKRQYRQTEKSKAIEKRYNQTKRGRILRRKRTLNFYIRHPEHLKAKAKVNNAIVAGKMPRANTLKCHYCPQQAQEYHHYLGYAPEHWLDVLPACIKCHRNINKKIA